MTFPAPTRSGREHSCRVSRHQAVDRIRDRQSLRPVPQEARGQRLRAAPQRVRAAEAGRVQSAAAQLHGLLRHRGAAHLHQVQFFTHLVSSPS